LKNSYNICFALCSLFYLLLFFLSYQLPLFYDNILFSSKIPDHFYQNGFLSFPLPTNIDTGYGPLWSWYIALGWKILGKSLWVNHLLCLPLLITTAWFYLKVASYFLSNDNLWIATVLLLLEPTYLAQSTMASIDALVVMGFMGGLYSIIYNKKWLLVLLSILLAMTSVRGVVLVFVLFVNQLVFQYYQHQKIHTKLILPYLIPASFFIIWILIHYKQTGYLLVREDSPWATHHQLAGFKQMLNNLKYIVWMLLDFGRLFLHLPLFLLVIFIIWKRKSFHTKTKILLHWCIWPLLLLTIILCIRTNPILHRYFMVYFLLISILAVCFFTKHLKKKQFNFIFILVFVGLISGHFWIYPDRITQGWDASLAHLPYFKLRSEMMDYINQENINYNEVATGFPMYNSYYHTNLIKNKNQFNPLHKRKLLESNYIIYTNVCNDFSVADMQLLNSEKFSLEKTMKAYGIKMQLYRRF